MKKTLRNIVLIIAGLLLMTAAYLYSGLYNIAADDTHWGMTERLLETVRTRSIERRAQEIKLPNLDDPQLTLKGAGEYVEMCVSCHLAPGVSDTPMRQGLYPRPPNLSEVKVDPRAAFWIIKHGIKMTAMPAWGASHDDEAIWSLVAFVDKLPRLSPKEYQDMVNKAPPHEDMSPVSGDKAHSVAPHTHSRPHETTRK